ncbi:CoA ester lyase [Motiliproteus sp. MSK22-1]|uniref:HpcH/HpaI aldolase/citrate lyase family protein n=1 Tax=Motiliproteus sp. MSK22-1 TaxID=1897630 RepID=UPI00097557F9|nr:CoA ester lyase [Motiliproteus sp. MSK22-1]OMH38883.1 hypothetical protein BGP75_00455 [Motiliproteus sp. MSK22-1]
MSTLNKARSYLFVPANRPDFIAKAADKNADVIVLDLEDSVPDQAKAEARNQLPTSITQLKTQDQRVAVRINSELEHLTNDLNCLELVQLDSVLLPKVESAGVISLIDSHLSKLEEEQNMAAGSTRLIAMIESSKGVLNAREIAASSPRISSLALGSEDLCAELGVPPTNQSLLGVCQQLVLAAAESSISALGFPGSIGEFSHSEKLDTDLSTAKAMGFHGALCIHPLQVAAVNRIFTYSGEQRRWAKRAIEAMDEATRLGYGACQLDGKMLDAPVIALARQILAQTTPSQADTPRSI